MRWFETRGPVYPEDNYFVARRDELADFVKRIERGRYIVLFAPRQDRQDHVLPKCPRLA